MKEGVFRFKQFEVRNQRSGLKVGTDGVLLGACATIPEACSTILDIGTGTGLIALMLAQRCAHCETAPHITGIDINADAAAEAAENFSSSPWGSHMDAKHISLQEMDKGGDKGTWDLIVSNPPYFENSLRAEGAARSDARHTDTLSYRDIIAYASRKLSPKGTVVIILPSDQQTAFLRYAASFSFKPSRILSIRTTAAKEAKRIIVELKNHRPADANGGFETAREELVMMSGGAYTEQFRALTGDFYL